MVMLNNIEILRRSTLTATALTTLKRQLRSLRQPSEQVNSLPKQNPTRAESCGESDDALCQYENDGNLLPRTDEQLHNSLPDIAPLPEGERKFVPTFNLCAYVDKSPTLQKLMQLGVDLNAVERRKGLAQFVLQLDFEQNIQPHLLFLHDLGIEPVHFGKMITKNPLIFKVAIDDMQTRLNYMESKRFTPTQISRIVTANPFWLMFPTKRIDRRLGHFQQEFKLIGDDVRFLASKQPKLITYNMMHVNKATFTIREQMGFDEDEIKCLLLNKPQLWIKQPSAVLERFVYASQDMKLSHDALLQYPEVLLSRQYRLKQRHEFLQLLGRAQYNPTKDLYISPKDLVAFSIEHFVENLAKSDMTTFENFLKTQ